MSGKQKRHTTGDVKAILYKLFDQGATNQQIKSRVHITASTLKRHRSNWLKERSEKAE